MDLSTENSACLVSHLIKCAFNINYLALKPSNLNSLSQTFISEELCDFNKGFFNFYLFFVLDLLDCNLYQSFDNFVKFANRSEISEFFMKEMAGWMHSTRMKMPLVTIEVLL
jgi:hypothetical protein